MIYGSQNVTSAGLADIARGIKGLDLEQVDGHPTGFTVVRGARRGYCFSVDGPYNVDPEDIPARVTATALGITRMYTVTVEGSSSTSIPFAVRFARALARRCGGAVDDLQVDEVWARGSNRAAAKPERGSLIDVIDLRWYTLSAAEPADLAARYLAVCRKNLPEALPRRFGSFEPLQGKLAADGDDAFASARADETIMLFFIGTHPCFGGHLAAAVSSPSDGPVRAHSLTVDRAAIRDAAWRDALRRLFLGFARASSAFFASAEVSRGIIWTGRGLQYGRDAERATFMAPRGAWKGLPPYPVWWSWFAADYAALVSENLSAGRLDPDAAGAMHSWSDLPADRDEIEVIRRSPDSAPTPWLPVELLPTIDRTDPLAYVPTLLAAKRIPPRLVASD